MIGSKGALRKTFPTENNQPYPVIGPAVDKIDGHFLGSFEPVGLEILCQHAGGYIEGDNNINSFGGYIFPAGTRLRSCKRQDEQCNCHKAEYKRQMQQLLTRAWFQFQSACSGHYHARAPYPCFVYVPCAYQRQQHEQPEYPMPGKCYIVEKSHSFVSSFSGNPGVVFACFFCSSSRLVPFTKSIAWKIDRSFSSGRGCSLANFTRSARISTWRNL